MWTSQRVDQVQESTSALVELLRYPAGGQLALLFEDLFKKMNAELLTEAKKTLSKANRSTSFDAAANLRSDIITNAMETALSTGCWNIKRFRMDRKGATQV